MVCHGLGGSVAEADLKELVAGGCVRNANPVAGQQALNEEGSVWCISMSTTGT